MKKFLLSLCIMMLVGCASVDRRSLSRLEPVRTQGNAQIFKFWAVADAGAYQLDSKGAERTRMEWLETWLGYNGFEGKKYEVLSRQPVLREKAFLGNVYDVYYEISVEK